MTPDDSRNFFQQEDDAWSRAIELALTPVVAGGIGYVLDRILGTVPVFTIVFLVLAVVGTFIKMYYAYDTKMKAHDAEAPWGRAQTRSARPDGAGPNAAGPGAAGTVDAPGAAASASNATAPDAAGNTRKPKRDAAADHAAANRASADQGSNRP